MKVQEFALTVRKRADVDNVLRLDAHSTQRRPVRDRRNDQIARVLKSDEASIKQMINAGRQQ